MPSWHWASKGGPKLFWRTQDQNWQRLHYQIAIEPFEVLKVEGFITKCKILVARPRPNKTDVTNNIVFCDIQSTIGSFRIGGSLRWILSSSSPERLTGIAIFDDEHFTRVHILFIMQWEDYDE